MLQFILDSKISKQVARLLVIAILLNDLLFPVRALALTGGPSQAEFSSFEPASSSDMVNLFTGDFSYNIPLLDVEGYPVNLAYTANPGIDQESGWVGLGWTLNSGAITRNVRGVPDDFKKDEITRSVSMKDHKAWGVIPGGGIEVSGDGAISGGFSAGLGVVYSNYKGLGYEFFLEPSLSISAGQSDGMSGRFSAGLGLKVNSQEGTSINASAGLSGQYQRGSNGHASAGLGVNIGASSNSRVGRDAWSLGASANVSAGSKTTRDTKGNISPNGRGMGVSFSGSIPLSSTAYSPRLDFDRRSDLFSYDFKIGGANCAVFGYGSIRGFKSKSQISREDVSYESYGYLYEHESKSSSNQYKDALLDYARDKDGTFYAETPNAPVTNHTYDMFCATAQGLYGAFHANRNDVGVVYDPAVEYQGSNIAVGAELGIGAGVNVGINGNYVNITSQSGCWKTDDLNTLNNYLGFASDEAVTSASPQNINDEAFFKFAGEKTYDNSSFYNQMGGEGAVRPELEAVGTKNYKTTNKIQDKAGATVGSALNTTNSVKTERNKRQNLVSYLNVTDAASYGIDKVIKEYAFNSTVNGAPVYPINSSATTQRLTLSNNKSHHISEINVLQTNGTRYIYGIPVYNRKQKEVSFSTAVASSSNGLVSYSTEATKGGSRPSNTDQFFESNELPEYAHSYLLTNVLSGDYVDRTNDGVTDDDLGSFTKFKYSRLSGDYKWRMPAEGANNAFYSEGLYADKLDQRGSYTYGEKEVWYPRAIESKNMYAEFILADKSDGLPVSNEDGTINTSYKLKCLKQIRLYTKPKYDDDPPTLIKTVNFEYDYSLCPGTPNSIATGNGKLTLKKIWFTTEQSDKGILNPYSFFYADVDHSGNPSVSGPAAISDANYNPAYNYNYTDRWGMYKNPSINPGSKNNLEHPYTSQDELMTPLWASAWNLSTVYTPSGSKISVDYEADDYAYVNDKPAALMYQLLGFSNTASGSLSNKIFDVSGGTITSNNYLHVQIPDGIGGGGWSPADIKNYFTEHYLRGENRIYFKACVKMDPHEPSSYEYVPGYADLDLTSINFPAQNSAGMVYEAVLKLNEVLMGDKGSSGPTINPFAKAALQLGRTYLPKIMYPGSEPMGNDSKSELDGLLGAFGDIKAMIAGINKTLAKKQFCSEINASKSVVRLYHPTGFKMGGGSRVIKIKMTDSWNTMTGNNETGFEYGQVYEYTTPDASGNLISSGVANYEPLQGGDENSNRRPITFSVPLSASLNDSYFQEDPYCESFYPNSVVGYSRVVVKNMKPAGIALTQNATGYTEHKFYTTLDYPTKEERTPLKKQKVKPSLASRVFNFNVQEKMYLSQGFVVKTNDMHGKLKSVKIYGENQVTPISGVTYTYKTKTDYNELDNKVDVLGPDQVISQQELGVETDIVNDSRSSKSEVASYSAMVNISTMPCTYWVPLVFFFPGYTNSNTEFYSSIITKTVQKFGILESIEAFKGNAITKTSNLLFDKETGETLLTKTNNQFDNPVYSFNYPAYWAYEGMSAAYKNQGMEFLNICATIGSNNGLINTGTSYFYPGDEIAIYKAKSDGGSPAKYTKDGYVNTCWVIEDRSVPTGSTTINGGLYLIDKNGFRANAANTFTVSGQTDYIYKITRSGRRNLQTNSIGNITSLSYPVNGSGQVYLTSGVLSAGATEYDEKWNMNCEQCTPQDLQQYNIGSYAPVSSIYCNTSGSGQNFFDGLKAIFSSGYAVGSTAPNPSSIYLPVRLFDTNFGSGLSTFAEFSQSNIIQNTSSFLQWDEFLPNLGPLKDYAMCHVDCYTNSSYPFNPPPYLFGYTYQHYESKIGTTYPSGTANTKVAKIILQGNAHWDYHVKKKTAASALIPIPLFSWVNDECTSPYQYEYIDLTLSSNASLGWNNVKAIDNLGPVSSSPGSVLTFSGTATFTDNTTSTFAGTASASSPCLVDVGTCYTVTSVPEIERCVVNPYLNGLRGNWHPKKAYDYFASRTQAGPQGSGEMSGNITSDGTYAAFTPFWWYQGNKLMPVSKHASSTSTPYSLWIKTSETDKIDWYGNVHQATDGLGRPSSTIYGYNSNVPVAAVSNAYANEVLSDGFEDQLSTATNCDNKFNFNYAGTYPAPVKDNTQSHTGLYSLRIDAYGSAGMTDRFRDFNSINPNTSPDDYYAPRPSSSQGIYVVKPGDNLDNFGPFSPLLRPRFVISYWVKVTGYGYNLYSDYPSVGLNLSIDHTGGGNFSFRNPASVEKSPIINGWQKVDYYFDNLYASGGTKARFKIELFNANGSGSAYFDDLRIHPYNATMQTKVYHPKTMQLMAELDDRNYATYYQYDEDLNLVRVNKETEKGLFTIKESRNALRK